MASGGDSSIKEITECSICLDTYKDPKGLPCLHTFCLQCLEKFCNDNGVNRHKYACPLCRKTFIIPTGGIQNLPNNFMMNQLMLSNPSSRIVEITDKTTFCELCLDIDVKTAASAYCKECERHICERHLVSHKSNKQSKSHEILMLDEEEGLCTIEKLVKNDRLKDNIKTIEKCTLESEKRIEDIGVEKNMLMAAIDATREKITDKYNQVLALINFQRTLLVDKLEIFKEKKLKEVEQSKDEEETRFQTFESFNSYLLEMEKKKRSDDATPDNENNDLHARVDEFVKTHCTRHSTTVSAVPIGVVITFIPAHFSVDGFEDLIGELLFPESTFLSEVQQQEQGGSSLSFPTTTSMCYPFMPQMPPGFAPGMTPRWPTPRWPKREITRGDVPHEVANVSPMRPIRLMGLLGFPRLPVTPQHMSIPFPSMTQSMASPYPPMTQHMPSSYQALTHTIPNQYPAMPLHIPTPPVQCATHPIMPAPRPQYNPGSRNAPLASSEISRPIAGQEPLTLNILADMPPQEQKQVLGERLFPLINEIYPDLAGKITGMLLEIDNIELLHMLESRVALRSKVEEAVAVLKAHAAARESV